MTPKSFVALAAVTVLTVAGAVATSLSGAASSAIAERGEPLFPGLLEQANRIAELRIDSPDDSEDMLVRREGGTFLDSSGYPVRIGAIRELVASIAGMVIEERKTDDPARLPELELAEPDAEEGGGKRVTLVDDGGEPLVSLIAGDRDYSVGGAIGGQYVRRADETQAWLVRGAVRLPGRRADWFDNELMEVEAERIAAVSITNEKGTVELKRAGESLEIVNLPEGREPDTVKLERMQNAFRRLALYDVRKAGAGADAQVTATVVITLDDGTRITLERLAAADEQEEKNPWFRLSATAPEGGTLDKAAKLIAERGDRFEFRLEYQPRNAAGWGLEDLTVEPAEG